MQTVQFSHTQCKLEIYQIGYLKPRTQQHTLLQIFLAIPQLIYQQRYIKKATSQFQ